MTNVSTIAACWNSEVQNVFCSFIHAVLYLSIFKWNKSLILIISDCVMWPHLFKDFISYHCLIGSPIKSVVNVLWRTSRNQPVAFCHLCVIWKNRPLTQPTSSLVNFSDCFNVCCWCCLFIYINLSQRVPAVTSMSVSFRFLKPMIFNTTAQWRNGQAAGPTLAPGLLWVPSLC